MTDSGDPLRIERRRLLQLASAGILAARLPALEAQTCTNANHGSLTQKTPYTAQFFTADELALLDRAMDAILPADEHSSGAHEAQVPLFADLMVATSPDDVKQDWRSGLRLLAAEIESSSLTAWLATAVANERDPQTVLDVFFVKLKQMTVEGYYTSDVGIHGELQYQGNTYLKEFRGCTHAEHQTQARNVLGLNCSGPASLGDQQTG